MKNTISAIVVTTTFLIIGCGQNEPPQQIQAIPDNPAEISIAGIAAEEIVPGLSRRVLLAGEGTVAEVGHTAVVHYTGWLFDPEAENNRGAKFDSSVDRGVPFEFDLGQQGIIDGWNEGVVGMEIGEVRELTMAPEFGYRESGAGAAIPPNSTLVFVIELVDLKGIDAQ